MSLQIINVPKDSYELLTTDEFFNLEATTEIGLPLFYESKNNDILDVDPEGNIFILNSGKTLVRIFSPTSSTENPIERYIFFNIKKKPQEIKFFLIPNLYIEETSRFSLNSYGFSTSGLPIKYRSLNPNIADIDENGNVIVYNVGTIVFEAYQEGDFEWESTKIIKELGISFRKYPFNLELTSRKSNTLIQFNLFQKNNNKFTLTDNLSGGLYFGDTKYSLTKILLLPTGEYIGTLNYQNILSGKEDSTIALNTFYSFSTELYIGTKQNKYLSFVVMRSGFLNYGIDIIVQGIFNEGNGYKYGSMLALESGVFWSGSFPPNQSELIFSLPLFYNNKIEYEIEGQLQFKFINNKDIPPYLIQVTGPETANFIISTGDAQSNIQISGLLPYYPKDLGLDFTNFNAGSFSLESYPK
jgi:hypothetical protein